MTQTDFIKLVATDANANLDKKISNDTVKTVINSGVKVLTDEVNKGEKITIAGLGSFEATERAAHDGRNPITGETIHIAAKKAPKFKAAKAFKEALNK